MCSPLRWGAIAVRSRVFAPATIGNVGPGFDVLGLCIEGLGDEVSLALRDDDQVRIEVEGVDADRIPRDPGKNAASIAAQAMLARLGSHRGFSLTLRRALPLSGGLGGSAAASVAGALAAAWAFGIEPSQDDTLVAALAGESAVAGAHLDNIAPCLLGGLTIVRAVAPPDVVRVRTAADWHVAVVTPDLYLETKTSRSVLPTESPRADWVTQMAHTAALVAAFAHGDAGLAARALVDGFAEPRRAPLLPGFERVKQAAREAGAIGCSISGAGPTVFALAESRALAERCRAAMVAAWQPTKLSHVGAIANQGARRMEEESP